MSKNILYKTLLMAGAAATLGTGASAQETDNPFSLSVSAGYEFDSNLTVDAIDTTSNVGDEAFVFDATAGLELINTDEVGLSLGYDFYQSAHNDLDEFDMAIHGFPVLQRRSVHVSGRHSDSMHCPGSSSAAHLEPFGSGVFSQTGFAGLHVSDVHGFPSSQSRSSQSTMVVELAQPIVAQTKAKLAAPQTRCMASRLRRHPLRPPTSGASASSWRPCTPHRPQALPGLRERFEACRHRSSRRTSDCESR